MLPIEVTTCLGVLISLDGAKTSLNLSHIGRGGQYHNIWMLQSPNVWRDFFERTSFIFYLGVLSIKWLTVFVLLMHDRCKKNLKAKLHLFFQSSIQKSCFCYQAPNTFTIIIFMIIFFNNTSYRVHSNLWWTTYNVCNKTL